MDSLFLCLAICMCMLVPSFNTCWWLPTGYVALLKPGADRLPKGLSLWILLQFSNQFTNTPSHTCCRGTLQIRWPLGVCRQVRPGQVLHPVPVSATPFYDREVPAVPSPAPVDGLSPSALVCMWRGGDVVQNGVMACEADVGDGMRWDDHRWDVICGWGKKENGDRRWEGERRREKITGKLLLNTFFFMLYNKNCQLHTLYKQAKVRFAVRDL